MSRKAAFDIENSDVTYLWLKRHVSMSFFLLFVQWLDTVSFYFDLETKKDGSDGRVSGSLLSSSSSVKRSLGLRVSAMTKSKPTTQVIIRATPGTV